VPLVALVVLIAGFGDACGDSQGNSARSTGVNLTGSITVVLKKKQSASPYELRVYDPSGRERTAVTGADVVHSSVRVVGQAGRTAALFFDLTKTGAARFHVLTRALARRGARLHRPQHFAVEVGGRIYVRPWVDYRLFPDGLPGDSGIEMGGMPLVTARRLARLIREG
jgi:hypothetical protein